MLVVASIIAVGLSLGLVGWWFFGFLGGFEYFG